jgi:HEAT repeat protein
MKPTHRKFGGGCSYLKTIALAIVIPTLLAASSFSVRADGCFVFKWDKQTDINEPTQKAIIVYDAGREDLLLQVKYEGPLEEFGWLIPVPSRPAVEKGSMQAFYELSKLTQQRFGATHGSAEIHSLSAGRGTAEEVKVIEIKTVGAYEVAVLSASESGSLARWLQLHGFSIPAGQSGTIDEYVHKGWYFVAAKIQLGQGDAFKLATRAGARTSEATANARVIQRKLSSGELHPLLISFDSPACIFPLKISAVSGKPSEVSLYVLSREPLLNRFLFAEACEKLDQRHAEWEQQAPRREAARQTSRRNMATLGWSMSLFPYSSDATNITAARASLPRDWSMEDLQAMIKEGESPMPPPSLENDFYASPEELLQCLHVNPDQITKSTKSLPRLEDRSWFLTKFVRTFAPAEMRDLEFVPAIPVVAEDLSRPSGRVAGELLAQLGSNAVPVLLTACTSRNASERTAAISAFEQLQDRRCVEPALILFKDPSPQVRLHAVRAAARNWDSRMVDPLVALFRDPYQGIRFEAAECLTWDKRRDRTNAYLALLKDPDPNVRVCAVAVLSRWDRNAIPAELLIEMVKDPNPDMQSLGLHFLWQMNRDVVPRADLLPLLASSRAETIMWALHLIEGSGRIRLPESQGSKPLTSSEAVVLATNRLALARLQGLKILERNGDAKAVELTLPLLKDPNSVIRSRAFTTLQSITGQNLSRTDAAKWEEWWAANRSTFHPRTDSDQKPF